MWKWDIGKTYFFIGALYYVAGPAAAPDGVQGDNATSTGILVKWAEVPPADRNGVIQGYRVKFKAVNESKEFPTTVIPGYSNFTLFAAVLFITENDPMPPTRP